MPTAESAFVHLHVHTDYSLLDGCGRIDRLLEQASRLGMPALAMTDHGNLFGTIEFYKTARNVGLKPLIGCEVYLAYDHRMTEHPKRERKQIDDSAELPEELANRPSHFPKNQIHHKGLIARNFTGYQNLSRIISDAHTKGMYYKPRTDLDHLAAHSEGLIALSGCMKGVTSQFLLYNDFKKAREATGRFVDIFGRENYFIEIMDHGLAFQKRIIPGLLKLAREFDLKIVSTNDVHYVMPEDWRPHDALLCIQTGKKLGDAERMKYPCREFYLKSRPEMEALFRECPEAVSNTLLVAEMCDLEIPFHENHYPVFEKPVHLSIDRDRENFNRILDIYIREKNKINRQNGLEEDFQIAPEEREKLEKNGLFLLHLCKKGLKTRYGIDYEELSGERERKNGEKGPAEAIRARLDFELAIIIGAGFTDYFLIVWDFIDWASRKGIPVGPGRGSGAGCLVAFVLKITDIDPLRFGLLFERMLNLERVSPPDFDVDFCMRRRDEVVDYVRRKYGEDRVANIITFGTFGAKMVVRDLARVNDIPYGEADKIAKMIPDELNISLQEAVLRSAELRRELETNPLAKEIVEHGKVIEGMVRNTGKHACGIIIGDQPITNLVPVTLQEGALTTQFPKGPVEELGLLKMDFLGLKTLTVIADARENVRRNQDLPEFSIEDIPLDDEKAFDLLNSGRTIGVFQLESDGMQSLCRQIALSSFEEIIALIALYRPGPMKFIPQFIEGKKNPATIAVPHPLLKDLVSETYGVLVYQEQVMEAARIIAGYTLGDADILRRAMGKKIAAVMAEQRETFVKGAKEHNGIDRDKALEIFAILEKFAAYGFNKSHSAAYAMLSYQTAFLKANYPVEFMAAVLSSELGNADRVSHFIGECNAMGLSVLGPDVNESGENFTPVTIRQSLPAENSDAIRFGLAAIKGVGDGAAHQIIAEREANGPYRDFRDFASRVTANRRVMEHLVKSGAFDFAGRDRGELLATLDAAINEAAALQRDRERGQANFFEMMEPASPSPTSPSGNNGKNKIGKAGPKSETDLQEHLKNEKELLGFYVSGHPLNVFHGLDEAINTFNGDDYRNLPDRTPFRLCGVISNISKKLSRRDNRPWAAISLATRRSSFTIHLYADAFEKCASWIREGLLALVSGTVFNREDDPRLSAEKMIRLKEFPSRLVERIEWVLRPGEEADDFLHRLGQSLENQSGKTSVAIGFLVDDRHVVFSDTSGALKWKVSPKGYAELRKHPSVIGARFQIAPPSSGPSGKFLN